MFIKELLHKLANGLSKTQIPLVVGIDPQLDLIHPSLFSGKFKELISQTHSNSNNSNSSNSNHKYSHKSDRLLELVAELYRQYSETIIDAVYDLVPAVKIQVAFFEPWGQYGIAALAEVISYAKSKDLLVIADAKRGDISSTAHAYANTFLSSGKDTGFHSPLISDALTVNPYMGRDSLEPFFKYARGERSVDSNKGVFVLLKTSNPGSVDLQDQELKNGSKVYELIVKIIQNEINSHHLYIKGVQESYSNIGVVVGATFPEEARLIRTLLPHSFFLVPGLGFQQGDFSTLKKYLNSDGKGALFNISRGIIFPHLTKIKDQLGEVELNNFSLRTSYDWSQLGEDIRTLTWYYKNKIKAVIE